MNHDLLVSNTYPEKPEDFPLIQFYWPMLKSTQVSKKNIWEENEFADAVGRNCVAIWKLKKWKHEKS
jgi:hypothetical protein